MPATPANPVAAAIDSIMGSVCLPHYYQNEHYVLMATDAPGSYWCDLCGTRTYSELVDAMEVLKQHLPEGTLVRAERRMKWDDQLMVSDSFLMSQVGRQHQLRRLFR
jgi:hypothetical protein